MVPASRRQELIDCAAGPGPLWHPGWLSGWPADSAGQPDERYATPADGSLPPPVGHPPAVGTVCFDDDVGFGDPCVSSAPVQAVTCGAFALWELPPAPSSGCSGYCLAQQ